MFKFKKKKSEDTSTKKKPLKIKKGIPIVRLGIHKKTTLILWSLFILAFVFAVYKNFTTIDKHTVHETKIVKQEVIDTNNIERFVESFAQEYYSWEQDSTMQEKRQQNLEKYLTDELLNINADMIRSDIPTISKVSSVCIQHVSTVSNSEYEVSFSVQQIITENKATKNINSFYKVRIYMDNSSNLIIIQNPTLESTQKKSSYQPKLVETDTSIDSATITEVEEFLKTFFTMYPTASDKEISYYANENIFKSINKQYAFVELVTPIFTKTDNKIKVSTYVRYLDNETKSNQLSQFELVLEKTDNWKIVGK